MKKKKLFLAVGIPVAAVLVIGIILAVVLLTLPAGVARVPVKDVINSGSEYVSAPAYTTGNTAPSALENATFVDSLDDLACFYKRVDDFYNTYVNYFVYNMKTDSIVYTGSTALDRDISISLGESYFVVKTTNYDIIGETSIIDYYTTDIYDAAGNNVGSARDCTVSEIAPDLIALNGTAYRFGDGEVEKAFEYSKLAKLPNVTLRSDDYYYEFVCEGKSETMSMTAYFDRYIAIYDLELNFVAKYDLPAFVDVNSVIYTVLGNGNIFVQYKYAEPDDATEYTYIKGEKKYTVVSGIVNAKNGKLSKLDLGYSIDYLYYSSIIYEGAEARNYSGFDADEYCCIAMANKIENKRVSETADLILIKNDGSFVTVEDVNGSAVMSCSRITKDCWVVRTFNSMAYIIDSKGRILANIGNARICGTMIYGDGNIYDAELNVLYDYESANLTVVGTLENAIVLRNEDGGYCLYQESEGLVYIASKYSNREVISGFGEGSMNGKFLVVKESSEYSGYDSYVIYNAYGDKVLTVRASKDSSTSTGSTSYKLVAIGTDGFIFSVTDYSGNTVYYNVH